VYPDRVRLPSLDEPYLLPTESCGHYFIVPVRVNGVGPFDFLLDSGAGRTLVDPAVIRSASIGRAIDSLSIGDFDAYEIGYGRLDTSELSAALGRRIDGIMGHPVFGGALMTWDFPEATIEIEAGELPSAGVGVVEARSNVRPFVRSSVGGTSRWILIDTGSSRGLTLRNPADLPLESPLQTTGARARVDGIHLVRTGRLEGTATIGPLQVRNPVVSNSVSVDLVGQEVLRFFRITFDQRNDRLRFERPDAPVGFPVSSAAVRTTGYAVRPDTASAEVIRVFREATPVREGDRIVEVDGRAWRDRTCPVRVTGSVADPTPDTVDLVVRRGDDEVRLQAPRWIVHPRPGAGGDAPRPTPEPTPAP